MITEPLVAWSASAIWCAFWYGFAAGLVFEAYDREQIGKHHVFFHVLVFILSPVIIPVFLVSRYRQ